MAQLCNFADYCDQTPGRGNLKEEGLIWALGLQVPVQHCGEGLRPGGLHPQRQEMVVQAAGEEGQETGVLNFYRSRAPLQQPTSFSYAAS